MTTQNGKTAQCSVVVTRSINSLSVSPTSKTLVVGESTTLTYTQTPSKDVSSETISWSSSNNNVATVNNGVVTAKAAGTATITVKSSSSKRSASCTIEVVNGYIIGRGREDSNGGLIKYNSSGSIEWSVSVNNKVNSVVQTADGGYIIGTGREDSNGGLIKYNSSGSIEWSVSVNNKVNSVAQIQY